MTPATALPKLALSFAALGFVAAALPSAPAFGQYYYNTDCPNGYYYDPTYGCQPSAQSYAPPAYGYSAPDYDYGDTAPDYGYGYNQGYSYYPGYAYPGVGFGFAFGGGERFHHRSGGFGSSSPGVVSGGSATGGSHPHEHHGAEHRKQ